MDATRLEGLAVLAEEVDAEAPPTPEQLAEQRRQEQQQTAAAEAESAAEAEARQWGAIAYMVGGALSMVAPELRGVYTESACTNWGRSVVPVSQKYGWGGAGRLPELALLISTLGLAVPSYLAIRHAIEQERAAGLAGRIRAWWQRRQTRKADQAGAEGQGGDDGR